MTENSMRDKSKELAKRIIIFCRRMKKDNVEFVLINQLLRCGTSIGANIQEAQYAQGLRDFISKLEIALKECNETDYWVELLYSTDCINKSDYESLHNDIIGLRRMLVSAVKTSKSKLQ